MGWLGMGRKTASGSFQAISSGGIFRIPLSGSFRAVSSLLFDVQLPSDYDVGLPYGSLGAVVPLFRDCGPGMRIQQGMA